MIRIKIISVCNPGVWWYSNAIGNVYECLAFDGMYWHVDCEKHKMHEGYQIHYKDAEIQKEEIKMENKLKPHKHAEFIKAWAEGVTIQQKIYNEWIDISPADYNWPRLSQSIYRIKPDPVPVYPIMDYVGCYAGCNHIFAQSVLKEFVSSGELKKYVEKYGVDGLKGQ